MNELIPILSLLDSEAQQSLSSLAEELRDTWAKQQVFRTETEARLSVLNDGKHPTPASKYWQAVREQGVMLGELVALSFSLRRNEIKLKRLASAFIHAGSELDKDEIQIDIEETEWAKANMERVAHDRVREIQMWSMLKKELEVIPFDTTNPNTHQMESLSEVFEGRMEALGPNPAPADAFNILSLVATARRHNAGKVNGHRLLPKE